MKYFSFAVERHVSGTLVSVRELRGVRTRKDAQMIARADAAALSRRAAGDSLIRLAANVSGHYAEPRVPLITFRKTDTGRVVRV